MPAGFAALHLGRSSWNIGFQLRDVWGRGGAHVWSSPNGLPMANTRWPTSRSDDVPSFSGFSFCAASRVCHVTPQLRIQECDTSTGALQPDGCFRRSPKPYRCPPALASHQGTRGCHHACAVMTPSPWLVDANPHEKILGLPVISDNPPQTISLNHAWVSGKALLASSVASVR